MNKTYVAICKLRILIFPPNFGVKQSTTGLKPPARYVIFAIKSPRASRARSRGSQGVRDAVFESNELQKTTWNPIALDAGCLLKVDTKCYNHIPIKQAFRISRRKFK